MYCCRRNRGYGTVHVLILMTAILTIVASVSVLTSIAIKGAASDELKTRLEVLGYDLFEITDEIVEEQMAEAYRRAFAEQQKRFAAGAQETDDAKKKRTVSPGFCALRTGNDGETDRNDLFGKCREHPFDPRTSSVAGERGICLL